MPFIKVASLAQLLAGSVMEVMAGGQPYAVCNVSGKVTALQGICPHRGGPLGQGAIHGNNVVCPWHAWEWDCVTGANDFNPEQKVGTCASRLEGDDILLEIPV